jgi:hypothetical protein
VGEADFSGCFGRPCDRWRHGGLVRLGEVALRESRGGASARAARSDETESEETGASARSCTNARFATLLDEPGAATRIDADARDRAKPAIVERAIFQRFVSTVIANASGIDTTIHA